MSGTLHQRVFALDDISIRNDGTGRTVTAYAAVFDSPTEIHDQDGHYNEQIARSAFDKTVKERGRRVGVFYNHARTLHGTPSERGSVPIGTPVEAPRADGRGLLTVTRYNKTPLADEVLESIRNGDITGQSFTGRFIKSDPRGPYLPARAGDLTLVTRSEIALVEYGPTPIPAYADAEIIGVRAAATGNITTPNAADLDTAARQYAASQGWAMDDGSYPVRPLDNHGRDDLESAIRAVGRGSGSHDAIRAHIAKRAAALGLSDLIPDSWGSQSSGGSGGSGRAVEVHVHFDGARLGEALAPQDAARTSEPAEGVTTPDDGSGSTSDDPGEPEDITPAADGTGADSLAEPEAEAAQQEQDKPEPQPHSATTDRSTNETRNDMDDRMTVEERAARQSEIRARLQEIDAEYSGAEMPQERRTEWDELLEENETHKRAIQQTEARRAQLQEALEGAGTGERVDNDRAGYGDRTAPSVIKNRSRDIYDLTEARSRARSLDELPRILRDNAMRAIELAKFPGAKSREDAQERAAYLVETKDDEHGTLARRMLVTGSPLYDRAFGKMMQRLSANGLSGEESRALALGVDASGGYAVPFQLDPTVMLTSDGTINPLRQVARVEQVVGKIWEGVTSAGVTVTRGAEGDEAPDSTPTLGQPSVATTRVQGFVPFSVEIERSWTEMSGEITMLLQDAKDTEEADSFALGDGTGTNASGVVGTIGEGQQVSQTGSAGAFTVPDDVFALETALPPRFRPRGSFLANKTIYNKIRSSAQSKGGLAGDLWARMSGGQPPELIGYPAYEVSAMSGAIAGSGGGDNLILAFGDFGRGFLIVDRIGMSVELVPHLFGTHGRPTGQRGIYAYWSNNSKIIVPNAIRVLNVVSPT